MCLASRLKIYAMMNLVPCSKERQVVTGMKSEKKESVDKNKHET